MSDANGLEIQGSLTCARRGDWGLVDEAFFLTNLGAKHLTIYTLPGYHGIRFNSYSVVLSRALCAAFPASQHLKHGVTSQPQLPVDEERTKQTNKGDPIAVVERDLMSDKKRRHLLTKFPLWKI